MDFGTILKGLGAIIGAIVGIGLAVSLIPPTIGLTAAGLVIVGSALVIVAGAIATLGNLEHRHSGQRAWRAWPGL
jgi:hypothetical protein